MRTNHASGLLILMSLHSKASAGKEIKHYCNRCGLDLWHTVIAVVNGMPARVKCNTCKGERNYKNPAQASKPRSEPVSRPRVSGSHPDLYQQKLKENLMKNVLPYRADQSFSESDVIDHPTFGRGIVLKLIFPDRMDVLFQDETKTLVRKSSS